MSSEALERLRTNARVHHTNGDVTLTALSSDVDALLAALAEVRECAEKAERERDEALSVREGLISPVQKVLQLRDALAVARKREQPIREAARALADAVTDFCMNDAPAEWDGGSLGYTVGGLASLADDARAALVDEPAAAPGDSGDDREQRLDAIREMLDLSAGWSAPMGDRERLERITAIGTAALRFWVERADRFEKALPPGKAYMKARGVCSESYARGRAALVDEPAAAGQDAAPELATPSQEDAAGLTAAEPGAAADEPGEGKP